MKDKKTVSRRSFVRAAGGALAAGAALRGAPGIGAVGANDKIGLGFIGVGGRGQHHIRQFARMDGVEIIAVSDAAENKRRSAAGQVKGKKVLQFEDYRRVLENKDVDAVVIATPDHWHAIPCINACQAGKDVYVEKPAGHNIKESRAMVEAARKYNRIVQHGTQQRSAPHWIEAVERVKSGELGKVSLVRAWNCWDLKSMHADMGRKPDAQPPAGVNYDLWLGPAPKRPYNRHHYDFFFYYFWDYSGGMLSAWGVHLFDVVAWAMGSKVESCVTTGDKLVFDDARETPDTAGILWECPGYVFTYEVRHGNGKDPFGGMDHGIEFYGTKGAIWINRSGYTFYPEADRSKSQFVRPQGDDIPHKQNFLDCMSSRKRPNADIEDGHLSCVFAHLGNIAYRVGHQVKWDAEKETIPGDAGAQKLVGREYRKPYVLPKV